MAERREIGRQIQGGPGQMVAPKPAWRELISEHGLATLLLVSLGVWLHAADGLLVSTMMPTIVFEIGGLSYISWTVALYELGSIVAGAASALLSVRFGLRGPMTVAALIFAFGCALSALAPQMALLLVGRLFQGLGGGGLMALCFVAVGTLYSERLLARAMAVVSTIWAVSAFLGPLVGGLFVEHATWRDAFWAFALQALILAFFVFRKKWDAVTIAGSGGGLNFPYVRLLLLTFGIMAIAYAGLATSFMIILPLLLAAAVCFAGFLTIDSNSGPSRILPVGGIGFRTPTQAGLLMVICFAASTIAIGAYGPFLIVKLHQTSALTAGYLVALEAICWTLTALVVSGSPEMRDRTFIGIGLGIVVLSIPVLAVAIPNGPLWFIALGALLQGVGFGMAWTFMIRRFSRVAVKEDKERVLAAIPTTQRIGFALGASYIGLIANKFGLGSHHLAPDYQGAATAIFLASIPIAIIGFCAGLKFLRTHKIDRT